ncbi:MAG: hypothetical protein ACYSUV_00090 [Planctomycetota bacterium]|jgi:hypothetical protein
MELTKAQKVVEHLLEMALDTGEYADFIHPEKHQKLAQRTHPMAKNPAYPEHTPGEGEKQANWEELLASEQYQATLKRLTTFLNRMAGKPENTAIGRGDFGSIIMAMMTAIGTAAEIEAAHKEELERLAIELIFMQPEFKNMRQPYENGEFKIDAKLGDADLERAALSPEGEEDEEAAEAEGGEQPDVGEEAAAFERFQDFDPEVEKRKVINAMIHGGAVSKNYAYQLIPDELNGIDPRLLNLYGVAMAGSELGYFATPDQMARMAMGNPEQQGGSSELDFDQGDVPVVKARGMIFPMLVQELAKGLLELVSYEGLPEDPQRAQEVVDKTDFVDHESWAMIMGRGLWTRFVSALGGNEDEITMHLYNRMVQMPADKFNQIMRKIQAGGPEAQEVVKRLAQDVRMDIEAQERDDAGYGREEEETPEYPEGEEPWR